MVPEGKFEWFLGVRYTYDHSTGSVKVDQESTIDRLLEKYGLTNCNPSKVTIRPDTDLAGLPISPKLIMRSSSIFSDILQESNICGSHGVLQQHWRKTLSSSKFTRILIPPGLMTRILARILVVTLYLCIMLFFLGAVSCLRLLRCLLLNLLVFVRKRFNSKSGQQNKFKHLT